MTGKFFDQITVTGIICLVVVVVFVIEYQRVMFTVVIIQESFTLPYSEHSIDS